jgi:PAS domain S-box-containing protein
VKHIILIVEDDAGMVELMTERLASPDREILTENSARAAVALLDTTQASLLILDYSLPDMNGSDFIVMQREKGGVIPPFIVSTGCGDERIAVEMMKLGAVDYVVKDANFLDLLPYAVQNELAIIEKKWELELTKQKLAEINSLNQQIISNSMEGIVVLDLDKNYKVWNPFMERITGLQAVDIVGKSIEEVPVLLTYEAVIDGIMPDDNHLGSEVELFYDIPETAKSGWVSITAGRLRGDAHYTDGYLFIIRDISERVKADMLLKKNKEELLDLFENAPIGYHELDLNGKMTRINQTGLKMLGYEKEEIIGTATWELVIDRELSQKRILQKIEQQEIETEAYERQLVRKDGTFIHVLISENFTYGDNAEITGLRASIQYITERKMAEREAERISKRFQAIIENSPDGFVLLNQEGQFQYLSPSTLRMFGFRVEDAYQLSPNDLTHPDDLENVLSHLGKAFSDPGYVPTLEYRFRHKDGHWIWIESTFSNLLCDPSVEALVINYRNIDERKKAEESLLLDERRLESLNRINEFDSDNVKDFQDFVLGEAIGLTGSTMGLIASYDESSRLFVLKSWSHILHTELPEGILPEFVVGNKGIWHELLKWRKPMVVNDMKTSKVPLTGHVMLSELSRFLAVPVFQSGKIVAVVAVANKKQCYDETDVRQLNLMMDSVLRIIDKKEFTVRLNESETKFRTIFHSSTIGKSVTMLGGKMSVNKAFADMLGYSIAEMENFKWQDITVHEDIQLSYDYLEKIALGLTDSIALEKRYYHKNGSMVWVKLATTQIKDATGKPLYYISEATDITSQKEADAKIRESEERYRILAENSRDVIWKIDMKGRYSYISPSVFELRGYTPDEVMGQSLTEIVGQDALGFVRDKFDTSLKDFNENHRMSSDYVEVEQLRKDGTKVWTESTTKMLLDENNQPIGYIGSTRDISARKAVEAELNKGRELLRELFVESASFIESDAIDYQKISDRVRRISGARSCSFNLYEENGQEFSTVAISGIETIQATLRSIFGYNLLGKKWKYDPAREKAIGQQVLTRFDSLADLSGTILPGAVINYIIKRFKLGEAWVLQISRKDKPVGDFTLVFDSDKTLLNRELLGLYASQVGLYVERVNYEKALKESEEVYRNLVERIPDGVYKSTHYGKFLNVNPGLVQMLGYESEEELLSINILSDLYLQISDRDDVRAKKGTNLMSVFPVKKKDGTMIWVEDHGWYNKDKHGKIISHEGVLRDITQRMADEEALRQNEEKFRLMFQYNPQPMFIYDLETLEFIDTNQAAISHYGYTQDEILGMKVSDLRPATELTKLMEYIHHARQYDENQKVQTKHIKKDGSVIDVEVYTSGIVVNQRKARQVLIMDITEQLKAEAALKASEANLQEALRLGLMGFWEYDARRRIFIFNDEFYTIYHTNAALEGGYEMTPEQYAQRFVHPEDRHVVGDVIAQTKTTDSPRYSTTIDHRIICADGTLKYINVVVKTSELENGQLVHFIGAIQDITERKLTELMLEKSELFFRQSQEAAHIGSYELDFSAGTWVSSKVLDEILGLNQDSERTIQSWLDLIFEEDRSMMTEYIQSHVIENRLSFDKEYRIQRKTDNVVCWVHGLGELVVENDVLKYMIGTIQDITGRKITEIELQDRMQELLRFQQVTVGRELTMIELKKEINQLLKENGLGEKYRIVE